MDGLTYFERTSLNWMRIVNDKYGKGLYGPTIRRSGCVPECEELVRKGLARRNVHVARGEGLRGYWILPAGRKALAHGPNGIAYTRGADSGSVSG